MHLVRRIAVTVLVAALAAVGLSMGTASATTGDVGYQGQSYGGAAYVPTSDKPQSKLWFAQGAWWADMFDTVSGTWHIFRLDRSAEKWLDTGVLIDDRADTLADALWDGTHLYVASHVVTLSSGTEAVASRSGSPARLYRYSYSSARGYSLDAGFPVAITDQSSESMTIDKDSTGTLWATWTQVSQSSDGSWTNTVYVNSTNGGDSAWGLPPVLPVAGTSVSPGRHLHGGRLRPQPDRCPVEQPARRWRLLGGARGRRTGGRLAGQLGAVRGSRQSDDHLNIKAVQADKSGRGLRRRQDEPGRGATPDPTNPQIRLLASGRVPGPGLPPRWRPSVTATPVHC